MLVLSVFLINKIIALTVWIIFITVLSIGSTFQIVTFMVLSIVSLVLFDLYYIGWSGAALGISLNMPKNECAPYSSFFGNDPDDCKKVISK